MQSLKAFDADQKRDAVEYKGIAELKGTVSAVAAAAPPIRPLSAVVHYHDPFTQVSLPTCPDRETTNCHLHACDMRQLGAQLDQAAKEKKELETKVANQETHPYALDLALGRKQAELNDLVELCRRTHQHVVGPGGWSAVMMERELEVTKAKEVLWAAEKRLLEARLDLASDREAK